VRFHWEDLPAAVRVAVEHRAGWVDAAVSVPDGSNCMFAARLSTATGPVFCKGLRDDDRAARFLRNEIRVNPHLPHTVPTLLWTVAEDGWLLAGFEHVDGRHANLHVDSVDLLAVFGLLAANAEGLTPCPVSVQRFAVRWEGLVDGAVVDGNTLLHTDMTPRNFLIGSGVWLVDWAGPAVGAAWIDTAFVVPRLILAGHSPEHAEQRARTVPAFSAAAPESITAFAVGLVMLWERKQRTVPAPHRGPLLVAAQQWLRYRESTDQGGN
jgi:hypothetical protein